MSFADTLASAERSHYRLLHLLVHQDPARLKFEASADVASAIAASGNSLLLKWRAMFCWLPLLFRAGVAFGFGFGSISCLALAPSCSGKWLFQSVSAFSCCPVSLLFFSPHLLSSCFILYFKSFLWCIIRSPAVDSVDGTKCRAIHFNGRRRPRPRPRPSRRLETPPLTPARLKLHRT